MKNATKVTISSRVPPWFRRQIGIKAAQRGESVSDYVYHLLRLAQKREDWLAREVARRSTPQMEFPPILQETREG